MDEITCKDCGAVLTPTDTICPQCGSPHKILPLTAAFELRPNLHFAGMSAVDRKHFKKKRPAWEIENIRTYRGDNGKPVIIYRIYDSVEDHYLEVVTDAETGEITHFCEEPLSEHHRHDSGKKEGR